MEQRISLSEDSFRRLVKGEVLSFGDVRIALQDIGYITIAKVVTAAIADYMEANEAPDSREPAGDPAQVDLETSISEIETEKSKQEEQSLDL